MNQLNNLKFVPFQRLAHKAAREKVTVWEAYRKVLKENNTKTT
jgi:hypothetical protein